MLVLDHLLPQVQQFLAGKVGSHLHLLALIGHSLLEADLHFGLLDALGLGLVLVGQRHHVGVVPVPGALVRRILVAVVQKPVLAA